MKIPRQDRVISAEANGGVKRLLNSLHTPVTGSISDC
jgi:hypothetical protein